MLNGTGTAKSVRVLITCGPSYEPLDQVRRLTNLSTGELGVGLAERLAGAGNTVVCLKGAGATFRDPGEAVTLERFTTNDDLAVRLRRWAATGPFAAVFHVAALCDFRVARLEDPEGQPLEGGKIPSRISGVRVHLEPTRKLIADLPGLFPGASVVGWKYEVDGTGEDAVRKGCRQMEEYGTHACVVNGPACGSDFLVCELPNRHASLNSRAELIAHLAGRLRSGRWVA